MAEYIEPNSMPTSSAGEKLTIDVDNENQLCIFHKTAGNTHRDHNSIFKGVALFFKRFFHTATSSALVLFGLEKERKLNMSKACALKTGSVTDTCWIHINVHELMYASHWLTVLI